MRSVCSDVRLDSCQSQERSFFQQNTAEQRHDGCVNTPVSSFNVVAYRCLAVKPPLPHKTTLINNMKNTLRADTSDFWSTILPSEINFLSSYAHLFDFIHLLLQYSTISSLSDSPLVLPSLFLLSLALYLITSISIPTVLHSAAFKGILI